ncbi:hypothetical protein PR048_002450 [Dryococelus australis]|uniref:Uncharacterized protein n=1 Tax=Dryococelus australis TaxID=614101 RepID=A0ABQ9IKA5_9NEOP|nr:hypothetical protein PR048_002450 [Dryococelus australis]
MWLQGAADSSSVFAVRSHMPHGASQKTDAEPTQCSNCLCDHPTNAHISPAYVKYFEMWARSTAGSSVRESSAQHVVPHFQGACSFPSLCTTAAVLSSGLPVPNLSQFYPCLSASTYVREAAIRHDTAPQSPAPGQVPVTGAAQPIPKL